MFVSLLAANGLLAAAAVRAGTLGRVAGAAAFGVGAGVAFGLGWPGYAVLLAYFVLGAAATRIGWSRKAARGIAEARGGARGVRQVLANGSPALAFAVAAGLLEPGAGGWAVGAAAGFVGSLAAAGADTVSSEVGKGLSGTVVRLTDLSRAPPGTPGGVSIRGSLAGAGAALVLAGIAAAGGVVPVAAAAAAAGCGFLAAFFEGLLAPLELRGVLSNDGVNFVSVLAGGLLAAGVAAGWTAG